MNGWSNFATWYVWAHYVSDNTEFYVDMADLDRDAEEGTQAYDLGRAIKEEMEEAIRRDEALTENGIAADLAECFLDLCNWYEMGKVIVRDLVEEQNNDDDEND